MRNIFKLALLSTSCLAIISPTQELYAKHPYKEAVKSIDSINTCPQKQQFSMATTILVEDEECDSLEKNWEMLQPISNDKEAMEESSILGVLQAASHRYTYNDIRELYSRGGEVLQQINAGTYACPNSPVLPIDFSKFENEGLWGWVDWGRSWIPTLDGIRRGTQSFLDPVSSEVEKQRRKAYLQDIFAVMMTLAVEAQKNDDTLTRGSLSVEDNDGKLYNFLAGYSLIATGKDLPQLSENWVPFASNFVYRRASSHYKGETPQGSYGIDTRQQHSSHNLPVLPGDMTHLLFARVKDKLGQEKTFIKFEERGLGDWSSKVLHGYDYVCSLVSHPDAYSRREKDLPRDLQHFYESLRSLHQFSKPKDVHELISSIETLIAKGLLNTHQQQEYAEILTNLQKKGDLRLRKGNEIIVRPFSSDMPTAASPLLPLKKEEKIAPSSLPASGTGVGKWLRSWF